MEILNKSEQNIVQDIVTSYNNNEVICIKDIIRKIYNGYIHCMYSGNPALAIPLKDSEYINDKTFFVVVQSSLFVYKLFKSGLILLDNSIKREGCNDYSNRSNYKCFLFKNVCGEDGLGSFVCSRWNLPIIPTTDLIELVKDKFRTPDQKRFECQKRLTYLSIFVAIAIGVLSPILTKCVSKKGEQENLEHIENAIKELKTVSIDSIGVIPKDTINVKIIQPNVKPLPISNPSKKTKQKN